MAQFKDLFVSFMLIGLVVVSLLTFAIGVQNNNNVDDKFIDDPLMNQTFNNLRSNLEDLEETSQTQKDLFESENPTSGFGTILLFSIVSSGKVFNGMIIGVFNSIIKLPVIILGVDPIVLSVLSTILILTIIITLWIVYKLGG